MSRSVRQIAPALDAASTIEKACRKACFKLLGKLHHGRMTIIEDQQVHTFGVDDDPQLRVKVHIQDPVHGRTWHCVAPLARAKPTCMARLK